jgi:hypothetical protein
MRVGAAIYLLFVCFGAWSVPIGTSFTYQGELKRMGEPAQGLFDFRFELFDIDQGGASISNTVLLEDVAVANGVFTVELDFGSAPYAGDQLWLEIGVREGQSALQHTLLLPRQKVTAVPYALHAEYVAMNAIGGAEIDQSQVQLRVDGQCSPGQGMLSVGMDGSVACESHVTSEGDPQFASWLSGQNVSGWNSAVSWGDHNDRVMFHVTDVTKESQPVTTTLTVNFDGQPVDPDNVYSTTTERFGAPRGGCYFFTTTITFVDGNGSDDTTFLGFSRNASGAIDAGSVAFNPGRGSSSGVEGVVTTTAIICLSPNDTVEVIITGIDTANTWGLDNRSFTGFYLGQP